MKYRDLTRHSSFEERRAACEELHRMIQENMARLERQKQARIAYGLLGPATEEELGGPKTHTA